VGKLQIEITDGAGHQHRFEIKPGNLVTNYNELQADYERRLLGTIVKFQVDDGKHVCTLEAQVQKVTVVK
jgi:hypothetical protein